MGKPFVDLTGKIFDRLYVNRRIEDHIYPSGKHEVRYECICECKNIVNVLGIHLKSGHTKSCGCYRKEVTSENKTTHGMTNSRLHNIWKNMKNRCYTKSNKHYSNYGGRGIIVCNEWLNDFNSFMEWSYSNGYKDNLTLDRKNVNGNYEPSNCRWITQKEQCNNTRRNIKLTFNNEAHTLKEWSEILNINYSTLLSRIKRGWSIEKALTTI